ncbi:MAG: hypothetical protein Q8M66_05425 [Actinomycetota bacterium]|nr:hypothetical protein [Actinomycetota bacterium]MDZ4180454.1 hypothetical protein [Coriobacteriia bacterium]
MTRRATAAPLALLVTVVMLSMLTGCAAAESEQDVTAPGTPPATSVTGTPAPDEQGSTDGEQPASQFAWADIELTDVSTGETLSIADFRGRPVLVKTFAVW